MKKCICSHALQWERGSSKLLVTQPFATWGIVNNTSVNTWALHRFRCNFKKNSLQARWQLKTRYYGNVSHTHTCCIMDAQMNIKNWVTTFDLSLGRPTYTSLPCMKVYHYKGSLSSQTLDSPKFSCLVINWQVPFCQNFY